MKCGKSCLLNIAKHRHSSSLKCGFTIVELLVVIVVIGILAAITIVSYTGISQKAINASLISDLTNAATLLKMDNITNALYPTTLAMANGGNGINSSPGTTYQYKVSNNTNPKTFCITATKNDQNYNITQDGEPNPGICPILHLDAGDIASYPKTGVILTDLSGNGNPCNLLGGVLYSDSSGGVLNFDGVNDYIDCGNGSSLSFGTGDFSVEVWVLYAGSLVINNTSTIISKSLGSVSTPGYSMATTTYGGSGANLKLLSSVTNDLWGTGNLETGGFYSANSWQNLVLVRAGTTMRHYRNGATDGQVTKAGVAANVDNSVSLVIGQGGSIRFNGSIGKIRIYNKALNSTEIQQGFNLTRSRYGI